MSTFSASAERDEAVAKLATSQARLSMPVENQVHVVTVRLYLPVRWSRYVTCFADVEVAEVDLREPRERHRRCACDESRSLVVPNLAFAFSVLMSRIVMKVTVLLMTRDRVLHARDEVMP